MKMIHLRWFSLAVFARFCKKRANIERITQANAGEGESRPAGEADARAARSTNDFRRLVVARTEWERKEGTTG